MKAANALKYHSSTIPEERKAQLLQTIRDYYAKRNETNFTDEEMIEKANVLTVIEKSKEFVEHGEYIIKRLLQVKIPQNEENSKAPTTTTTTTTSFMDDLNEIKAYVNLNNNNKNNHTKNENPVEINSKKIEISNNNENEKDLATFQNLKDQTPANTITTTPKGASAMEQGVPPLSRPPQDLLMNDDEQNNSKNQTQDITITTITTTTTPRNENQNQNENESTNINSSSSSSTNSFEERNKIIEKFVKMWRKHFIEYTKPQYLSKNWKIDDNVYKN